jgi:methyl-accepting chemotaxis protein
MVGDAGKALSRILAQVMEITRSVAAIAAAGKEQSRSLHEFATAATELEKSAENNAAMVEQTAVATQGLSADSVRLVELTRQFRLTEESTDGQTFRSAEAAPALSRLGMLKVPR